MDPAGADWSALGTQVWLVVTDPATLAAGLDPAAGPVQVSPLLAEAIGVALRAAALTGGDVDPTVGAAMVAIGYDRDFAQLPASGPPVKLAVRAAPGWQQVHLDEAGRRLTLPQGVRLDLGATAKAWAADRSATRLATALGCGVLVGLGRRAGHVEYHRPPLAARRCGAAPYPRSPHRAARPGALAHRVGGRGQLRGREYGQHGGHYQRPRGR